MSAVLLVFILFSNIWIVGSTTNQVYESDGLNLAENTEATLLVLGTRHKTMEGGDNLFFKERIRTANMLYNLGFVDRMILSGDHIAKYYDEPSAMRAYLVEFGVPDSILVADDGGARTLDSVIRCKQVFNVDDVIIVTQRFHAYRALFISNYYEMPAIVVATKPVESSKKYRVLAREILARPLAVLDLYVFHRKPQYNEAIIN
jgi:SanA protein